VTAGRMRDVGKAKGGSQTGNKSGDEPLKDHSVQVSKFLLRTTTTSDNSTRPANNSNAYKEKIPP
jgi:hypothetical protein